MSEDRAATRWTPLCLFAAVVALTAYPPAMSIHLEGVLGAFRYFAADTFYYLAVAVRSGDAAFYTFDGVHPTNGFHPFWQYTLTWAFRAFELTAPQQVLFVAWTSIALVATGTGLFALAALRLTGRPALALLACVPGIYAVVVPAFNPHHATQWSFANGMESPLSVFFFGVLVLALVSRPLLDASRAASLVIVSSLLTCVTLSRLDDVFLFVPFLLLVAGSASDVHTRARRLAIASFVPTLAIGAYLLYNASYAGTLLPSSGGAKSQPLWALARNAYASFTTLAPFADPLGRAYVSWQSEAWRVAQMVVPAGVGVWWLVVHGWEGAAAKTVRARCDRVISVLSLYVVVKCGYNFAMVGLWNQGQWYYPLCIMTANLIAVVWLGRLMDEHVEALPSAAPANRPRALLERAPRWIRGRVGVLVALAFVLVSANDFVELKRHGRHQSPNHAFWAERVATRAKLEAVCPGCGVLSFDDGIVAFALDGVPTMNGLGLVLDSEGAQALADGGLLDLAWQRGHRLFVSVNYPMPRAAYTDAETLRTHLAQNAHLRSEDLAAWRFEVAFETGNSGVAFVRFEPRER